MAHETLTERVQRLELTVEGLQALPGRFGTLETRVAGVEDQILHLRTEMRGAVSDIRAAIGTGDDGIRRDMRDLHRQYVQALKETETGLRQELGTEVRDLHETLKTTETTLRREMRDLHEQQVDTLKETEERLRGDLGSQMRILHEDLVSRISVLGEQLNGSRKTRKPRRT
jgi:hypothetical protein